MDQPFFQQRFEVRLVQALSHRNLHAIPMIVTRFVSAQQQNGTAAWVERIKDAQRTGLMLHTQLSQVWEPGTFNPRARGKAQLRPQLLQQSHRRVDGPSMDS
jgi:hypothetical protein